MAKKKQRGFKMFDPGGPLVIPQSAMPSYMAPATNLSQAPTPNISQPMQGAQTPAIGLSSIGGALQGVTDLYQTITGNLSVPKIQEQDFTAGSKQELLSKATDFKGYEMPKTDAVSSGLGGAVSGAAAGTAIAPGIGTAIGAGVGLVGGAVSSIFGNSKRKRAKQRAERDAMNNINAQNTELTDDSIYSSLSSQLADGGDLYDDTSSKNRGKITAQNAINRYDGGGWLGTGINEDVATAASFLPVVGTLMDGAEFIEDPSWEKAGWFLGGLASDIFTGGAGRTALKGVKLARKTAKASKALKAKRLEAALKRGNQSYSTSMKAYRKAQALEGKANQDILNGVGKIAGVQGADILLNSSQQNTKALGGSLAHSGEFSNGVTLFENGGTHEENPLGGIPQGYNENGDLNLVEQGETKWKDYIFSDRNKLSKAERFGLPGILNNRTFSSAAKTIQKESEERPLDLISKRGLNKQMDYLMSAQEEHNAMVENPNQFKSGGQMNFKSNKRVPGSQGVSMNGNPKTVKHAYGDWLRYAPVASNVIGLASDIASTPETIQTSKIEAPLLTEKMSYDPIDQEYLTNKLTSNYAGLVDKIQGSSGGNRGVANASMIAAMNNLYDAYGDTAIKSKEYNRDMLAKTLEFNRATSQANAQMRMSADQYNANAEDRMTATNAANRAARRNAIREQIAGLGENLGAIGTEQRWMDLAPKLFRGYKSNGDHINQTIKNIVLDKSDSPSKANAEKRKKAKEVKNG